MLTYLAGRQTTFAAKRFATLWAAGAEPLFFDLPHPACAGKEKPLCGLLAASGVTHFVLPLQFEAICFTRSSKIL